MERISEVMRSILNIAKEHKDAWPFLEPVDPTQVPDYYVIIKDPIGMPEMSLVWWHHAHGVC